MPERPKQPPRRRLGFFDVRDRVLHLQSAYRTQAFGSNSTDKAYGQYHRDIADLDMPEPDEELEDAEISDGERRSAIARERLRRERQPLDD